MRERPPSAPPHRVLRRLLRWLWAGLVYQTLLFYDTLRGRRSQRDRAVRLRQTLERMGGTGIKLGQQLSIRLDMLPTEYCEELASMLDRVPPFEFAHARSKIEASIKAPLESVFASFNPVPIGSASIACVYRAVLHDGQAVAVKVQRPGIRAAFNCDLTAIDWLLIMVEFLTLVRPGMVRHMRSELRSMFMEEVDFGVELRYQHIFRQQAKRDRLHWLSAPKGYPQYSSSEVLVSEFVEGMQMVEVLRRHDSKDPALRASLAALRLKPKKLGLRLINVCWWGTFESPIFHGDPHPANIIVQPDNRLVFVDFGACGSTPAKTRRLMFEVNQCALRNDAAAGAQVQLQFMTPLPHIDVRELARRLEEAFWQRLMVMRDKDSPWWKRTTAAAFMDMMKVSKEFNLPANIDTVRVLRCSLLYDTIACRLYPDGKIDDFRGYLKGMYKRSRRRLRRDSRYQTQRAFDLLLDAKETLGRVGNQIEVATESLPKEFLSLANRKSYTVAVALRLMTTLFGLAAAATGALGLHYWMSGSQTSMSELLRTVLAHPAFQFAGGALLLLAARRVLFRVSDVVPRKDGRGR